MKFASLPCRKKTIRHPQKYMQTNIIYFINTPQIYSRDKYLSRTHKSLLRALNIWRRVWKAKIRYRTTHIIDTNKYKIPRRKTNHLAWTWFISNMHTSGIFSDILSDGTRWKIIRLHHVKAMARHTRDTLRSPVWMIHVDEITYPHVDCSMCMYLYTRQWLMVRGAFVSSYNESVFVSEVEMECLSTIFPIFPSVAVCSVVSFWISIWRTFWSIVWCKSCFLYIKFDVFKSEHIYFLIFSYY